MEKWVVDFARCEELVDEILEKVSLVTDYESEKVEKGPPLVQKKVEKLENWEMLVSLMRGAEKEKIEEKKLKRGSGERKLKEKGGGAGNYRAKESLRKCPKTYKSE